MAGWARLGRGAGPGASARRVAALRPATRARQQTTGRAFPSRAGRPLHAQAGRRAGGRDAPAVLEGQAAQVLAQAVGGGVEAQAPRARGPGGRRRRRVDHGELLRYRGQRTGHELRDRGQAWGAWGRRAGLGLGQGCRVAGAERGRGLYRRRRCAVGGLGGRRAGVRRAPGEGHGRSRAGGSPCSCS